MADDPAKPQLTTDVEFGHLRSSLKKGANKMDRTSSKRIAGLAVAAFAAFSGAASAQTTPSRPPLMTRDKEIALALSACRAAVAAQASVYVLEKAGYAKARDGSNGFVAIVQHSMPTSQEPQCMDAEGARAFLPRMFKVAELRAQGKTPAEIQTM